MKTHYVAALLSVLLTSTTLRAQSFPRSVVGTWRGILRIENAGKPAQRVPMRLTIDTLAGRPNRFGWIIQYDGQPARTYELVVVDAAKGQYQIDEKDGIVLDAQRLGNRLVSQFSVADNLLTSVYTLSPGRITFEIFFSGLKTTKTGPESGSSVLVYPVGGYQRAELTR